MDIFKKLTALILMTVMLFSLSACGSSAEQKENGSSGDITTAAQQESAEAETEETQTASDTGKSDILVVYFSRTGEQFSVGVIEEGNTAIVAKMIAEKTGADLFEILPADDHYPMTYEALTEVALHEQDEKARPEYAGDVPDLSNYSTIFIGAPVWWGDWPMIMYTFFENNADALAGKTLIPFSTHEGSGLAGFDRKLASACPDSTVKDGFAVRGSDAQNNRESASSSVNDWLSMLGY